jgi:very-short-patch-repair endonuclease
VSTPEQLWVQLASVLTLAELVAAGDYLVHHRLPHTTIQRLSEAVASNGTKRGTVNCRAALPLLSTRSESPRESLLRVLLVTASLPGLQVNLPIVTTDGYRYRGDLAFPRAKMIVEYQGDHHRDPAEYRKDLTRISRIEADDWYVMQVGAGDLDNPNELVARIRRKLASRLG